MLRTLLIGEVVNVHGVKGALKVRPLTDRPARFSELDEVNVILPQNSPKQGLSGSYKIVSASVSGDFVLLKLDGINDRDKADFYRNAKLEIPREKAIDLPDDTYFIGDLVGSSVYEITGNAEELLGKVTDILQPGGNDVYVVTTPDRKEILLPAIESVIREVDIERGIIKVTLLPGLREVYLNDDEN